jgi:DNA-directed RNA polymerase specialized sigma54-like protein
MSGLKIAQVQSQQMRQELRQVLRIEQANLLQMPEGDFHKIIGEIEKDPLFVRLCRKEKIIRQQKIPRIDISPHFFQPEDELVASSGSLDTESLLQNKEQIVRLVAKLGIEKFKCYFLFPESGMTPEEIAEGCNLNISEVREINDLIDDFSILSEFYHPSALSSKVIHYSKIASIERQGDSFIIGYYHASSARGRYLIDYESFEELKAKGALAKTEAREAKQLFKRLELINSRQDTVNRILQGIIDKQALYLECGAPNSLLPFSQKELAREIGVAPSSISRAISSRSLETPWGSEIPLKEFFPRPKKFKRELIRKLLETEEGLSSDEAIRAKLQEKFGVVISRRSVANLRKELKFPAARNKNRHLPC